MKEQTQEVDPDNEIKQPSNAFTVGMSGLDEKSTSSTKKKQSKTSCQVKQNATNNLSIDQDNAKSKWNQVISFKHDGNRAHSPFVPGDESDD